VTNQTFNGDGSTVAFTLNRSTTSAAALIMLNGVTQLPGTAYNISPNPSVNLIFTEAPAVSDVIDIRYLLYKFWSSGTKNTHFHIQLALEQTWRI
jgi:hypothetical protein